MTKIGIPTFRAPVVRTDETQTSRKEEKPHIEKKDIPLSEILKDKNVAM